MVRSLLLSLTRVVQYYAEAWPLILQAVASAMDTHDPCVQAAMDGLESPATATANGTATPPRTEPTALFFVIYGLVYEALSVNSSDAPSAQRNTISLIAMHTLNNLVRPEYAGNALLDAPIFDELISLWYRMAMTETPALQIQLLETISAFAVSYHTKVTSE